MPQMVPCPPSRIEESSLFKCIRLDYLGPLYVKVDNESSTHKVWVCLFTCLAIRVVHLEIINDMSAKYFLFLPKQFLVFLFRRGKPKSIISYIKSVIYQVKNLPPLAPTLQTYVANEGIK